MRAVHIVPGNSSGGGVRAALGESPDLVVVGLVDPLSCGPLARTDSLAEWANMRYRFWQGVDGLPEGAVPSDVLPDLGLLERAETITVWLGNCLGDQVCLPWIHWVLTVANIGRSRLRIVQFPEMLNGRDRTPKVGLLRPDQISQHPPAAELSTEDSRQLEVAWDALTSDTPFALMDFVGAITDRAPLQRALARLARRYPQADTGLACWEYQLLSNVAARGPKAARIIGHTLGGPGWDTDSVGDYWLLWRLRRLGSDELKHPLVAFDGDPFWIPGLNVSLTEAGREVLDGKANAVELNGIDDWVGGVHLSSAAGRVWFATEGTIS